MNINSQGYNLPIQTAVNLQTDSLRRENQQREIKDSGIEKKFTYIQKQVSI